MQPGSLQLLSAGSFSLECQLIKVTTVWHSALLDNFPSKFPQGQTQYELGMSSKGSENAGKYTVYDSGNYGLLQTWSSHILECRQMSEKHSIFVFPSSGKWGHPEDCGCMVQSTDLGEGALPGDCGHVI